MAFHFALESLLRLRRGLERQAEQRLFATSAVVAGLRARIENLEKEHFEQKRRAFEEMTEGSYGAAFQFIADCDRAYTLSRQGLQAQLEQAEKQRMEQLQRYKEARQKKEILEGLRDHQKAAYDLVFARKTQQRTDEAFLLRLFFNPTE